MTSDDMPQGPSPRRPADTARVLESLSRSNRAGAATRSSGRGRSLRFVVLLLVLCPLLLAVLYAGWQQRLSAAAVSELRQENEVMRAAQQSSEAHMLSQIARLNNQIGDLMAERSNPPMVDAPELDEQLRARLEELPRLQEELVSLRQELSRQSEAVRRAAQQPIQQPAAGEWQLAEAAGLLDLAHRRLELEGDARAGLLLLQDAEQRLQSSGIADNTPLRQQLSDDLRALQAITPVNIEDTYRRLAAISQAVSELSLPDAWRDSYQSQLQANWDGTETVAQEQGFTDSLLNLLGSIFLWRERGEGPDDTFRMQHGGLILQNLQLLLEQAQLALLRRQESLFQQALQRSADWLGNHGLEGSVQGQLIRNEIASLQQLSLQPDLPDLSRLLQLVSQLSAPTGAQPVLQGSSAAQEP